MVVAQPVAEVLVVLVQAAVAQGLEQAVLEQAVVAPAAVAQAVVAQAVVAQAAVEQAVVAPAAVAQAAVVPAAVPAGAAVVPVAVAAVPAEVAVVPVGVAVAAVAPVGAGQADDPPDSHERLRPQDNRALAACAASLAIPQIGTGLRSRLSAACKCVEANKVRRQRRLLARVGCLEGKHFVRGRPLALAPQVTAQGAH